MRLRRATRAAVLPRLSVQRVECQSAAQAESLGAHFQAAALPGPPAPEVQARAAQVKAEGRGPFLWAALQLPCPCMLPAGPTPAVGTAATGSQHSCAKACKLVWARPEDQVCWAGAAHYVAQWSARCLLAAVRTLIDRVAAVSEAALPSAETVEKVAAAVSGSI